MRPENFTAATSRHAAITQFNFLSQDLIVLAQEAKVDPKVDHFGLHDSSDFEVVEPLGDASKDPCCIIKRMVI